MPTELTMGTTFVPFAMTCPVFRIHTISWWIPAAILSILATTLPAQQPTTPPPTPPATDTSAPIHKAAQLDPVRTVAPRAPQPPPVQTPRISTTILSSTTLSAAPPLGEADLLHTVTLLPGVIARNDYDVGYDVRGGESDQNLIRLDGIPLYNPFHIGGLFGTFIDDAVGHADFLSGAFPAQYDSRLSSVLDVTSAEDPRPGIHGTAGLSLLAAHTVLGGALPGSALHGSWDIAARRTYADAVISLVSNRVLPYHFYDTQFHAVDTLPSGTRLAVTVYHGYDVLDGTAAQVDPFSELSYVDSANTGQGRVHLDWSNWAGGATLSHTITQSTALTGDSLQLSQRLFSTNFSTNFEIGDSTHLITNNVRETGLSGMLTRYQGAHAVTLGYDYSQIAVDFHAPDQPTDIGLASRTQALSPLGLYAEDLWTIGDRLVIRPGLRLDHVGAAQWTGLSPRLSIRYKLTDNIALTAGGGQYAQWMHSILKEDEPVRIFNYWVASDQNVPVSTAQDLVAGLELWPTAPHRVRVELFRKRYVNLTDVSPTADPSDPAHAFLRLDGESHGADVLLQLLKSSRYSGWISYSYTKSTRTDGTIEYAPAQDRRNEVDAVWRYETLSHWALSAHFGYGSGTPYTNVVGQIVDRFYDPTTGTW
ncbi:MAG TPA: TonB-dependent receptor, partial [Gemmatimonadaceae bacterium]|nr:TonB-dependent receptor [Gemmatimonadaceae bacterium]